MAKALPIGSKAVVAITDTPRPRQEYSGFGESKVIVGRLKDDKGRELSAATALVSTSMLGIFADTTVLVPDAIAGELVEGSVHVVLGDLKLNLAGGDFGKMRSTVLGIDSTQIVGDIGQILNSLVSAREGAAK